MLRQAECAPSCSAAANAWARDFFEAQAVPAMAFAVASADGLAWSAAHGLANLELSVPATTGHRFRLGSVSKVITTVAAARLVSRGLLELDTPIAYWLPDLPKHHRATTLRQLFTHTAGVRHYGPQDMDPGAPGGPIIQRHYPDRASILALFIADPLVASPGTRVSYSSFGYTLASLVMEAAAGQDFLAVIPDRVSGYFTARELEFLALRMPGLPPPAAEGGIANMGHSNPAFCWAGAGLLATMPDLARFGASLLKRPESGITAAERALLFTPLTEGTPEQPALGLGWRVDADKRGRSRWHHAGTTPGGRCGLIVYPEQDLSIALASNTMMTPGDVLGPASELADLFG